MPAILGAVIGIGGFPALARQFRPFLIVCKYLPDMLAQLACGRGFPIRFAGDRGEPENRVAMATARHNYPFEFRADDGLTRRIDRRAISWFGNRNATLDCDLKSTGDCIVDMCQRLSPRFAMRGAGAQAGHVGDPAGILAGPEQVDMLMRLVHPAIY